MRFKYLLYFALLLGFVGCTSTAERQRMLQSMELVDSMNRNYISLVGDTLMPVVTLWMDRHGSPNERVRAHYLQAAVYRDCGQVPEALEELQVAAQCADTMASDCDFRLLSRVHGQMAELFYDQLLPQEALEEEKFCQHYALKDNDTLMWLVSFEKQSQAYYMAGQVDSAIITDLNAYEITKSVYGQTVAANYIEPTLLYFVESDRIEDALHYINIFETYSDYYDRENKAPRHIFYYYTKGSFYSAIDKNDSAIVCFKRLLEGETDSKKLEGAYKGLYLTYLKSGQSDSVAKYADLCYKTGVLNYRESSISELQRMHSQYNYSVHQRAARQKENEANEVRLNRTVSLSICAILILVLLFILYRQRVMRNMLVERLTKEYEHQIEKIQKVQEELSAATLNEYRIKYEKELLENQQQLLSLLGIQNIPAVNLRDNEIYDFFLYVTTHPSVEVKTRHWKALEMLFDEKLPAFRQTLTRGKSITDADLHLCMLIRMQFGVAEICTIMGTYSQYVSTRRSRLLKKIFNIKGKPEDFDNIVMSIN